MTMFSGIINYLGIFIKQTDEGFKFKLPVDLAGPIIKGSSIAINGVCLTVKDTVKSYIYVDVMEETIRKTTLGTLQSKDTVNLEMPVTAATLLSGHIVQGHIDGIAKLADIIKLENSHILKFSLPPSLSKYIVPKGSIAVNGIALTVIEAEREFFTVGIIPFTWNNTMLHTLKLGDFVNIEVDILAKYVERLLNEKN